MNNNSKFSNGFILGLIIGGGAVFLLGTKTGKNLLKIVSEQGLDGLLSILEDYDLAEIENTEDEQDPISEEPTKANPSNHFENEKTAEKENGQNETESKRRFFKRRK